MQRRSCHFLAARPIASIGPAAKKEGRNERGGNRYVRPTATAPHLDSTEDGSLPPVGRAAGIVKGFRTPAGHGRDEMRGGRRPKSLGGGNRGPAWHNGAARWSGALELWGFESRGQPAATWGR